MADTPRTGISHVGIISVNVRDLDRAIAFYTEKLGFALLTDAPMGPDARWVEVAPAGAETRLSLIAEGNPAYEPDRIGSMVSTFEVNGFEATCEGFKAKGVEFRREPKREFFGWWAEILDADGNILGLHAEA